MKPFKVPMGVSRASTKSTIESESRDNTFSTIDAPNEQIQLEPLAQLPICTQPIKKPKPRFERKQVNHDIDFVFRKTFKKEHYKGRQFEVMEASMEDRDCLMIAPTSLGKVSALEL